LLWKHVPAGDVQMLRRRFEEMGRVRLSDVEKAQSRIVSVIREMDENGEIVAPRAGDAVG
ncbi:MAG TPA: FliG C-terminal domain-containing protein, partial [Spirochaetia bacterium]|nr:FliG C-terminal domain-containing protein [Spirochaetia bacterium]